MSQIAPMQMPNLFKPVGIPDQEDKISIRDGVPVLPVEKADIIGAGVMPAASIPLGTLVSIHDRSSGSLPYEGTVVTFIPEIGVAAAPAIIVQKSTGEQVLVPDTGVWEIRVLATGLHSGPSVAPDGLRKAHRRVNDVLALRYTGDPAISAQIDAYARGAARAVVESGDTLRLFVKGVAYIVNPGDVIVVEDGEWMVMEIDDFDATFEVE